MVKVFYVLRGLNIWWLFVERHIIQITLATCISIMIIIINPCFVESSFLPRIEQVSFENSYLFLQPPIRLSQNWLNGKGVGFGNFIEGGFHDGKLGDKLSPRLTPCISSGNINSKPTSKQGGDNSKKTAYDNIIQYIASFGFGLMYFMIGAFPCWIIFQSIFAQQVII